MLLGSVLVVLDTLQTEHTHPTLTRSRIPTTA